MRSCSARPPLLPALAQLLPLVLALEPMSPGAAIIASVVVILVVLIAWKFLKLAFKIALVVAAAIAIYFALSRAGII